MVGSGGTCSNNYCSISSHISNSADHSKTKVNLLFKRQNEDIFFGC